jgi:hypothetical protein
MDDSLPNDIVTLNAMLIRMGSKSKGWREFKYIGGRPMRGTQKSVTRGRPRQHFFFQVVFSHSFLSLSLLVLHLSDIGNAYPTVCITLANVTFASSTVPLQT